MKGKRDHVIYGRRRGRQLRPGRERLLHDLLPEVVVPTEISSPPETWFRESVSDVWLEVGFGAGEHLAELAAAHPEVGFIGCEPFRNGVASLLASIDSAGLRNIRVFPDDARALIKALPARSIGRAFVLFPDPWPKTRHHRRRIIVPETLCDFARILRQGAEMRLASDDMGYVRWMLSYTLMNGGFEWLAQKPADWRCRPPDWPPTRYESKALGRGIDCVYLRFQRNAVA